MTKNADERLGTCDTPHKLTCLPSKESPWVQQPHAKTDSCTRWKPESDLAAPAAEITCSCGIDHNDPPADHADSCPMAAPAAPTAKLYDDALLNLLAVIHRDGG